jgi:hypothetical protein
MYSRKPEVSREVGRCKQTKLNKWRKMANNREDNGLAMREADILAGSVKEKVM